MSDIGTYLYRDIGTYEHRDINIGTYKHRDIKHRDIQSYGHTYIET